MYPNSRALTATLFVLASAVAHAQSKPMKRPEPKPAAVSVPPGPSMSETIAWLSSEAPPLLRAYYGRTALNGVSSHHIQHVTALQLDKCQLTVATSDTSGIESPISPEKLTINEGRIALAMKDVDVGGIVVEDFLIDILMEKPAQILNLKLRSGVPGKIEVHEGEKVSQADHASLFTRNRTDGERVAAAVKRAAILCGAPASPF